MRNTSYDLKFSGYWRSVNASGIQNSTGIYCVYSCVNNPMSNTVNLTKLIYIGESRQVQNRIYTHEKIADWLIQLNTSEELCFSYGEVHPECNDAVRQEIESLLIYYHSPICNEKNLVPSLALNVQTSGANWGLNSELTFEPKGNFLQKQIGII